MPTTNAGTYTENWEKLRLKADGSCEIDLIFIKTSNSQHRGTRTLFVPANSGNPIVDQDQNIVAAGGTWGTLATAISTFVTAVGTTETNAAGGGKLDI